MDFSPPSTIPKPTPYPAPSKHTNTTISGTLTTATCTRFTDRILITISQDNGILSQWVQVPLLAMPSSFANSAAPGVLPSGSQGLLPLTHLEPTTLLGDRGGDRETLGHGIAAQIATRLTMMDPEDRRVVVLGLGLKAGGEFGREQFFDVVELGLGIL